MERIVSTSPLRAISWLALGLGLVPAAASAAAPTVSATQTYSIGGVFFPPVINTTVADVLPWFGVGSDSIFGHTYAYPDGTNGSRSSGTNNFSINGVSLFLQDDITAGASGLQTLNFHISNGEVGANIVADADGSLSASVDAVMKVKIWDVGHVNSTETELFSTHAAMLLTNDGSGNSTLTFSHSGTDLGSPLAAFTTGVTSGLYNWSDYFGSVQFTLAPGETADFSYEIKSQAEGVFSNVGTACTVSGYPDAGGGVVGTLAAAFVAGSDGGNGCLPSGFGYNNAIGRIGDPFNLAAVPSSAVSGVPEPQTWLMMGLGFGALGFMGRRKLRAA